MGMTSKNTKLNERPFIHPFEHHEAALQSLFRFQSCQTPEDSVAQDVLVQRLYEAAITAATSFCRWLGLLPADEWAMEVVHEWFCQLRPHRAKRYRPDLPLFPYAYAALWYIAVGMAKREKRHASVPLEVELPDVSSDPQHLAELMEIGEAANALPSRLRDAISLRFFHGLSGEEVANVLQITPGAVRNRVHRGVSVLRQKFADSPK